MKIVSVQHALPKRVVTNEELVSRIMNHEENAVPARQRQLLERALRTLLRQAGANTRRHQGRNENALGLGIEAGRRALDQASLHGTDIDLLIYVGVGRGVLEPATACAFQKPLGLANATCFDVLDACASWLRALDIARQYLQNGIYDRVLILNSECNFEEYIRWDLRSPRELDYLGAGFTVGDAATATILQASDGDEYCASFRTSGAGHGLCQIPLPNAGNFTSRDDAMRHPALKFYSYGQKLGDMAIDQLVAQFRNDARFHGRRPGLIVGHTYSVPAKQKVLRCLELDPEKYLDSFPEYGNTVSASLPLGLSLAGSAGRVKRGEEILLLMGSAGVTTGLCRLKF